MTKLAVASTKYKLAIHDVLIFLAIYFMPALAHWSPFPIAMLEPMRVFLFVGFFLSYNKINAIFLAISIPLFSFLATGHPVFFKSILISIELLVHLGAFILLYNHFKKYGMLFFIFTLLLSKVVYYFLKFLFLNIGLIKGNLFSGGFDGQLIAAIFVTSIFALFFRSSKFLGNKNV